MSNPEYTVGQVLHRVRCTSMDSTLVSAEIERVTPKRVYFTDRSSATNFNSMLNRQQVDTEFSVTPIEACEKAYEVLAGQIKTLTQDIDRKKKLQDDLMVIVSSGLHE